MTHSYGPVINFTRNITKNDFINICNDITIYLNNYYSKYYNIKNYVIKAVPEQVIEGGILLKFVSDIINCNEWYKSIRIYNDNSNYPIINNNDDISNWINNNDIIYKKNSIVKTSLKSLYSAPRWNKDEVIILLNIFNKYGILYNNSFHKIEYSSRRNKNKIHGIHDYEENELDKHMINNLNIQPNIFQYDINNLKQLEVLQYSLTY